MRVILSAVISFTFSQILKAILRRDIKALKDYGGMPSGHTALVVGTTTSVGFTAGWNSPCFGLAFSFSLLLLSDILRLRPLISPKVVHRLPDMVIGGILGVIAALLVSALP